MKEHMDTQQYIAIEDRYGAHNYHPLDVVIARAEGIWVYDVEGKRYLDFLSAYSAVNQGHRHPRIVQALKDQADKVTLTSRAFRNDQLGLLCKELCELTGYEKALPMNSGTEAIETALKAARKWGYRIKGVPAGQAEIIACTGNFHGRSIAVISFSTEPLYRNDYGPFTPGFRVLPYGDADALAAAITPHTVAFLVEPIQGESGVRIPPDGYLRRVAAICREHNVLLMTDEIQSGLGRAGKLFACEWEDVRPDVMIIGKALSGGVYPASAVLSSAEVLGVFEPGSHGSTLAETPWPTPWPARPCASCWRRASSRTRRAWERISWPGCARSKAPTSRKCAVVACSSAWNCGRRPAGPDASARPWPNAACCARRPTST